MLNLSVMPLDADRIDELCDDIVAQQRDGVSTHAMFMMTLAPEGTPPVNKAEYFCKIYDEFRIRLDKRGAKYGVLAQSTMGHVLPPNVPHPFQTVVSLVDGGELKSTCCPLDKGFQEYIKGQMRVLARHAPSIVLLDDDLGLLYRATRGCACPLHMAEFNRRAGTNMTREELFAHTQGDSEEDRRYTEIYVQLQSDAMAQIVAAMREGLDGIDPSILGAVSGIFTGTFCEFTDRAAAIFAGRNNPKIARMNNGVYTDGCGRGFTSKMYRAAMLREFLKGKIDILLAETDTCPHNRYSTSAAMLHAHFTASVLEGAKGAKHWITRLWANEPQSGTAYRKTLAKYSGFYEALVKYAAALKPAGCRIPLSHMQNYGFVQPYINLSPWSTCVLERMGLPLYFSAEEGGAVFLDDVSADTFTDEEIAGFFKGTLVLSAHAAARLCERGFAPLVGVKTEPWNDKKRASFEWIDGHKIDCQQGLCRLTPIANGVEVLSHVIHADALGKIEILAPAVTAFDNPRGGCTVVFCGTPDTYFNYICAFSMLNESRKRQFIGILKRRGDLPVYYPGDAEIYLRAGKLETGELFCAVFNLGTDVLDEIELVCENEVRAVEKLNPDGTRSACGFSARNGAVTVKEPAGVLLPVVLFLS